MRLWTFFLTALSLTAVLLTASGCDTTEEQRSFDVEAFLLPNGLGNDDWQIGPLFEAAAFFLEAPPSESVSGVEPVSLTLSVLESAAFGQRLLLETSFDKDGDGQVDPGEGVIVLACPEYRGERQLFVQFNPALSDPTCGVSPYTFPRGATYRVRLLSRGEVVTYGDIRIAQ